MGHEHDRGGRSIEFIYAQKKPDACDYRNKNINLARDKGIGEVSPHTASSIGCWSQAN